MNTSSGTLAVGAAAAAVVDEPARIAHWSVGAPIVLLVVGGHHVQRRREQRTPPTPAVIVPAPRGASGAYMSFTSARP